ncbi:MAG: hypothetical protein WB297_03445 [Actinomycetota bacterium]
MSDWSTVASLATALGTLVLALATFVAVRAANRAARVAEYSMQIGIRPLLMPSRLEDTVQKIMWGDEHWARLSGAGAVAELADDKLYLAMSVRNAGSGVAVIHGWHLLLGQWQREHPHAEPDEFRRQLRDLYVPGGDVGFWQAAIRERDDPEYDALLDAVTSPRIFGVELLYSDHEGGQRAIGRFALAPVGDSTWLCSVTQHWNLDRPDPR